MSISKHEVFNFCFMNQNIMLLCYIENGGACYFLFGESAQIVLYVLIMSLHFFPVATDRTAMSFTFFPFPFFIFYLTHGNDTQRHQQHAQRNNSTM